MTSVRQICQSFPEFCAILAVFAFGWCVPGLLKLFLPMGYDGCLHSRLAETNFTAFHNYMLQYYTAGCLSKIFIGLYCNMLHIVSSMILTTCITVQRYTAYTVHTLKHLPLVSFNICFFSLSEDGCGAPNVSCRYLVFCILPAKGSVVARTDPAIIYSAVVVLFPLDYATLYILII